MLQAMFSGVSGLNANQTDMDVIGNNIANVNTTGFKASSVTFEDQLSQTLKSSASPTAAVGGQNPLQVGLGVTLGSVNTDQTQGNLEATGSNTDMAIQGSGYFMVSSGDNTYYTRDGSFNLDSNGVLVNPANGLQLLGYVADDTGNIDTSQPITSASVLKIPVGTLQSVAASTNASLTGNLDSSSSMQSTAINVSGDLDPSTPPTTMTSTVYDSQGNAHTVAVSLADTSLGATPPTGAIQAYTVNVTVDGTAQAPQTLYLMPGATATDPPTYQLASSGGSLEGTTLSLTPIAGTNGAAAFPLNINFAGLTAASNITTSADGAGGLTPKATTAVSLSGTVNANAGNVGGTVNTAASTGGVTITNNQTIYDSSGNAYTLTTTLENPTTPVPGATVPTGATEEWDMVAAVAPAAGGTSTTVYDSTSSANNESKVFYVPGVNGAAGSFVTADSTGGGATSSIQLNGSSFPTSTAGQGLAIPTAGGTSFPITLNLAGLSTTSVASVANGQSGTSPTWNTSLTLYDSLGVAQTLNVQFTRSLVGAGAPTNATSQWGWTATENGTAVASSAGTGNSPLYFDNQGNLIDTGNQTLNLAPTDGAQSLSIKLNFGALTSQAGQSSVATSSQDGYPVGTLQSFNISEAGLITGVFSNGQSRTLGQVATATFTNPAGLDNDGQNLYSASSDSGLAQVGLPSSGSRGSINTGFLEMSNVDLSTEFTNLIITQRGFEANTKIISTVDQLLQDVIDMKR